VVALPAALAVAALAGGPAAWAAPLAFVGEYPGAVGQVGPIPDFLGDFPSRVPSLADFAALLAAACWGHTRGEIERMWQFLVPFAVVVAVRQLLRWRASLPLVAALLLGQALAIQVLFYTRW
jgi:hypothetical protein